MESDASRGAHASEPAPGDSIRSLIVSLLTELEFRCKIKCCASGASLMSDDIFWSRFGAILGMDESRRGFRVAPVSPTRLQKKIYVYTNQEQVKRQREKVLSKIWESVWRTSKPLIAAYAAKKLAEKVKSYKNGTAMNGS